MFYCLNLNLVLLPDELGQGKGWEENHQQRRHGNRMGIVPQILLPGTELGPEINVMGCGHLIILPSR